MKMISSNITNIFKNWPYILGLVLFFIFNPLKANEVLDENFYSNLSDQELDLATSTLLIALETLADGEQVDWKGEKFSGYIIPSTTYMNEEGYFCRDYLEVFQKFSEFNMYQNKACRDHDGEWVWFETSFTN